ncbi:SIS domain-containing protein [Planosporangium thailandense]|uniref:SIS domain-containing protein n=1 Tax=Planosporangium thailandense TaxID=765197 RepID=A0ABX0XXG1_9ACTN|nr:SIS domain-containing protein [Planosporangium thailandense]
MLNFDEDRFVRIQSGAIAQAHGLRAVVAQALEAGATNLFLLGSGGAGILMEPTARLLRARSTFPVFHEIPAEVLAQGHAHLGAASLVVIPSLSGTTKESLEVLDLCQARGATTVALTAHGDSPLAQRADHVFVNFAADDTSCESFYLQSLALALAVMQERKEIDSFDSVLAELALLPTLLLEAKRAFEPRAKAWAEQIQDEPYHIFTGAGATWAQAWYYAMCILEEMQWIRTRPVHANDFFHGTLELVEPGVSVVVLTGEDSSRPLSQRVAAFAAERTDKLTVFDTTEIATPGISPDVRALISPVLLATVLERVSAHLEVLRDHPLTTRRYYRRVRY